MDNLTLINEIDQRLADSVDATRRGHAQIKNVMDHFRKKEKMDRARARQNRNGTQKAEVIDESE